MSIEAAFLKIGSSIATTCGKALVSGRRSSAERTMSLIDLANARGLGLLPQRRLQRQMEQLAEEVADKMQRQIEVEFRGLPRNEQESMLDLVAKAISDSNFSDDVIFAADVSAGNLFKIARATAANLESSHALGEQATELLEITLREAVEYLAEVIVTLPSFRNRGLRELLERDGEIITLLHEVLSRMPSGQDSAKKRAEHHNAFELEYLRDLARKLDRVEIFGVTLTGPSRRYSLSTAYLNLSAVKHSSPGGIDSSFDESTNTHRTEEITQEEFDAQGADHVISQSLRTYIRGEAGSGKTTLLRWLALRSAQRSHDPALAAWNNVVPIVLELRRFSEIDLPAPSAFLHWVSKPLSERQPDGWVHAILQAGRGALLVDGVDEYPEHKRRALLEWVDDLVNSFPKAQIVLTSRPSASAEDWLSGLGFQTASLLPMTPPFIDRFVEHWHDAVSFEAGDLETNVDEYRWAMKAALRKSRSLRQLAENPLLCALLCALNWNRKKQLPTRRIEIYRTALEMLLIRRDHERNIKTAIQVVDLGFDDRIAVLSDLAFWFTQNELSDAPYERVLAKVDKTLLSMPSVTADAEKVLQYLIARSGVIREPSPSRVDFVHKTFQEYLAATRFVEEGLIEALVRNATRDAYREVVVMAAGSARAQESHQLVSALLDVADKRRQKHTVRAKLRMLAALCVEVMTKTDPQLFERVVSGLNALIPPKDPATARTLASLGDDIIERLPHSSVALSENEAAATVQTAGLVGGEDAMAVIASFKEDSRAKVQRARIAAWSYFDPADYAASCFGLRSEGWDVILTDPSLIKGLDHVRTMASAHYRFEGPLAGTALLNVENYSVVRSVSLSNNSTLTNLDFLKPLSELRYLGLERCWHISDYEGIRGCENLETLVLRTGYADADISVFENLRQLRRLTLNADMMQSVESVGRFLPNLRELDLSGYVEFSEFARLGPWPQLVSLTLSECESLRQLTGLPSDSLRQLTVSDCVLDTLANVADARELRELSLADLEHLSDFSFVRSLTKLESIKLTRCGIEDLNVLSHAQDLKYVSVSACDDLGDVYGLISLPELQVVELQTTVYDQHDVFAPVVEELRQRGIEVRVDFSGSPFEDNPPEFDTSMDHDAVESLDLDSPFVDYDDSYDVEARPFYYIDPGDGS